MAKQSEAEHKEDEEERQRFADRVLAMLEDSVYWAIALRSEEHTSELQSR